MRGLQIAIAAYRIAEKRRGNDNPDFRPVFLSWARAWRKKETPESTQQGLATDPHSPNEFRCNQVVRNIDEFYQAFGVTETDELFLPKEQRVSL